MNVIWNPNPLATVVELDDADRKLLWHRVKIEELEEKIVSAHFALDSKHREWLASIGKGESLEDAVAKAIRKIDYDCVFDDNDERSRFDVRIDDLTYEYIKELTAEHSGDCTCVSCSCMKCHAESLIGIDTIAGLGNHEASKIGSAFSPKDKPSRTLNEVIEYLRDYDPRDVPDWCIPHVPRWIEEGKRAHAWLVAYQSAHFSAGTVT